MLLGFWGDSLITLTVVSQLEVSAGYSSLRNGSVDIAVRGGGVRKRENLASLSLFARHARQTKKAEPFL